MKVSNDNQSGASGRVSVDAGTLALKAALQARYGRALNRLILFGSAARRAYEETSDVDVLVVLDLPRRDVDWRVEREVRSEALAVELEYDIVFDLHVVSSQDARGRRAHTPFLEVVLDEGRTV